MEHLLSTTDLLACAKKQIPALVAYLEKIDPGFKNEWQEFQKGVLALYRALPESLADLITAVLDAEDSRIMRNLIYLFWQGIQQNIACTQQACPGEFLKGDQETICNETILNAFPEAIQCSRLLRELQRAISAEQQELISPIVFFYSYVETVAYKLAHLQGFQFADIFLPLVIPGYVPNAATTVEYAQHVKSYLNLTSVTTDVPLFFCSATGT